MITTIAGEGSGSDGGPAISASIYDPGDIIFDNSGNLFFSEDLGNVIRKIDVSGVITTIAGTGIAGFSGDGGLATNAELNQPQGIAFDTFGNLYIADGQNHRIRKVDAITDIITTICGNGTEGFSGDGGLAIDAVINSPGIIRFDKYGNLYIPSGIGARIRKINSSGIITTIAGNGIYGDVGDGGLAIDAEIQPGYVLIDSMMNLYINDVGNNIIRRIDGLTGIITRFAGDSGLYAYNGDEIPALSAHIDPSGIVLGSNGLLYIGDRINNRVRMIDSSGIIHTIAGNGTPTSTGDGGLATFAGVYWPAGLAFDQCSNLYIAQIDDPRIRKVTYNNTSVSISSYAGDTICSGTAVSYTASILGSSGLVSYQWFVNNIVVSTASSYAYIPVNGDSIRVVINTSNACSGTVSDTSNTIHMTVIGSVTPTVSITASADSVCEGTAVTLTATPAYGGSSPTYEWIVDGISVATGSTYTYIPANGDSVRALLTSDMACITTATASSNTINFIVEDVLIPSITISGPVDVVEGGPVTFTATVTNAGSDYIIRWFDHGSLFYTSSSDLITFIKPYGLDKITAEVIQTSFLCNDSAFTTDTAYVQTPTGVNNVSVQGGIGIYPNPAYNTLTIQSPQQITTVSITNIIGQKVYQQTCAIQKAEINISNLPSGIYYVKINEQYVQKFVKE